MNAFFNAQFTFVNFTMYNPLMWMFHSRNLNNKINRMHKKFPWIIFNDNTSSYEELLEIENPVSLYLRNLHILATELYKIVNGLSPEIIKDISP